MKPYNLLSVGFMLSELAFTACDSDGKNHYEPPPGIEVRTEQVNSYAHLLSFSVGARDWRMNSVTDRHVEVVIPEITDKILKAGMVVLFLNEGERHVSLPFTYYQVRRAMSFQPSYQKGRVFVNVLGNFILNLNTRYTFKVLIVPPESVNRFRIINWYKYEDIKKLLNGPDPFK